MPAESTVIGSSPDEHVLAIPGNRITLYEAGSSSDWPGDGADPGRGALWTWSGGDLDVHIPRHAVAAFSNATDAKCVDGGRYVLMCSPDRGGVVGLVERSSKRLVHYVTNIGQSVHSVALLPAGRVVVVSSWDNLISVFSLAEDRKLFELKSDDDGTGGEGALGFPHGVLWDDAQSAVWVAGRRGSPKRAGGVDRKSVV